MQKLQPGGKCILCIESVGRPGGVFGLDQAIDGLRVQYSLESAGNIKLLDDLQWGDWDREGHLLVATRFGKIQIRDMDADRYKILFEQDLSDLEPSPTPAPHWAQRW